MRKRTGWLIAMASCLCLLLAAPAAASARAPGGYGYGGTVGMARALDELEDALEEGVFVLCDEGRSGSVRVEYEGGISSYRTGSKEDVRQVAAVSGIYYAGECAFLPSSWHDADDADEAKAFCDERFGGVTALYAKLPDGNRGWIELSDVCYVKTAGAAKAVLAAIAIAAGMLCGGGCGYAWWRLKSAGKDGAQVLADMICLGAGSVLAVVLVCVLATLLVPYGDGPEMNARHFGGWHEDASEVLGIEEGRTYVVPAEPYAPSEPPVRQDPSYPPTRYDPVEPAEPYEPSYPRYPSYADDPGKFVVRPEEDG